MKLKAGERQVYYHYPAQLDSQEPMYTIFIPYFLQHATYLYKILCLSTACIAHQGRVGGVCPTPPIPQAPDKVLLALWYK